MENMRFDFSGQVAVITGGAQAICRGVAIAFGKARARVFILDINETGGESAAEAIRQGGGSAMFVQCDVTGARSVQGAFSRVRDQVGRIDILVNGVGGFRGFRFLSEYSEEEWDRTIDLNLKSVFLCSKAAIPLLTRGKSGRIINIGSIAGQTVMKHADPGPYSAAKAGVHALTRTLAFELGRDGITVNTVAPATTATERALLNRGEEQMAEIAASAPLRRVAEIEDTVGFVLFLATSEAGFLTGQTISVNGGRLMI
ncbi:MAG: SDR family NAD(P)-dependent oxidoreductase [Nitrospinota bacterium]